jgi:hypothetical protein
VHIEFTVDFSNAVRIEKNQHHKDVYRTLLGKPETQLVATNTYGV